MGEKELRATSLPPGAKDLRELPPRIGIPPSKGKQNKLWNEFHVQRCPCMCVRACMHVRAHAHIQKGREWGKMREALWVARKRPGNHSVPGNGSQG